MDWNQIMSSEDVSLNDIMKDERLRKKGVISETILESLQRVYDLQCSRPNKLFCNHDIIENLPSINIPDMAEFVEINKSGESYTWNIDIPDEVKDHVSATTLSKVVPRSELNKLRHEFVAEAFQLGDTDCRLDQMFKPVDDDQDKLTPDFMLKDELGVVHAIEIATTRAVDLRQIQKIIEDKLFKYENALFLRSKECPVTLSVVVINHHAVYSTLPLSNDLIDDLMIRYKIMIGLENVANSKGIKLFISQQEEALSKLSIDILSSIENISIDKEINDDGLLITESFIKECLQPVDHNVVSEAFSTSLKANPAMKARDWSKPDPIKENATKEADYNQRIGRHLKSFKDAFSKNPENRTERMKPILNLPNIIPTRTEPSTQVKYKYVGNCHGDSDLSFIWQSAFNNVTNDPKWNEMDKKELLVEALETRKEVLIKNKEIRKTRMKARARVLVPIKPGSRTAKYLAMDGIKGKNTKDELWRKLRRKEQSKSLHFNTYTIDVDDFINSDELYKHHENEECEIQAKLLELASIANDYAMNSDKGIEMIKDWNKTRLLEYSHFVSEVSSELTVSLRQHVKRGELLLKKLRNYNCYMLLAPAGLKSPIGVSFMFPKTESVIKLNNFIGRELLESESCYFTKFITVSPDKLENWYNLPSMVISLVSFLSYHYDIRDPSVHNCLQVSDFKKMLNFMIAVRLEDKSETEESITQTRYMYMESMRGSAPIVKPEPLKVLSKISDKPRSRLNLWVIKQILNTFTSMSEKLPIRLTMNDSKKDVDDVDPLPTDTWSGLINYVTGSQIPSASSLLNLFYIGYLKNKNNDAQGNTNWALLEKTLKEEFSVNWADVDGFSGKASVFKLPSSHQFNVECIKAGSEALEKRLQGVYGKDWQSNLRDRILQSLSRLSSFNLATLKASSTTTDEEVSKPMTRSNNRPVKRRKVLSAVVARIKLYGINPFKKLSSFYQERLSGSKKARTDLFKKQQHGGLREIFVMDEITRVIQLFIETCSRTICSEFEEESLTNPKKKLPIINNHFRKSKRYSNKSDRFSINYNSSMDKTRWSQGFMIRALAVTLFRMTPESFHGAIQKGLNMWIGKNVKIPPEVIDLLLKDVRLSSKEYERLRKEFHGVKSFSPEEKPVLDNPRSGYLSLKTGFMQGILHYTSSLLHLGFLSLCKSLMRKVVEKGMPGCDVLISFACSSDDSAVMVTLFYPKDAKLIEQRWVDYADHIEKLLHTLEIFCLFFCMRPSTKSAIAMMDSVEFNSEFIFNNTLAVPIIKFVTASQNVVPYESFIDKLQGHYNLLSDLAGSGMPAYNVHLCQLAQLMIHYKSLGYGLSPLDAELHELMKKTTDPNLGFFPLDNELCPGVMGFPFTQYLVSTKTGRLPVTSKIMRKEPVTVGEDGAVSETIQILHGDRRKQKKLLLQIHDQEREIIRPKKLIEDKKKYNDLLDEIMKCSREEVDKNYELFYRAAETEQDLYCKLKLKVLMPGVAKSLMSSNTFVQTVSVSLYSAHTDCVTVSTERIPKFRRTTDNETGQDFKKHRSKMSLLAALKISCSEEEEVGKESTRYKELEAVCFPLVARYQDCVKVIGSFKGFVEIETPRFRKQKNRIELIPLRGRLPLTLLDVVKAVWFGHEVKTSKTVLRRCLDIYKNQFPWVSDTHNESLEKSPFTSASEMFGFLNSVGDCMRTFVAVSPNINSTKLSSQLTQYISKNFKSCTVLKKPGESKPRRENPRHARNNLDLALLIPLSEERESAVKAILSNHPLVEETTLDPNELNKRDLALYLIQGVYTGKLSALQVGEIVKKTRIGYQLFYLSEQTKRTDKDGVVSWVGKGEVMIHAGDDFIIASLKDDQCIGLYVTEIAVITRNLPLLKQAMEEMGVRPVPSSMSMRTVLGKFNGDKVVHKNSKGCPIFKDLTTRKAVTELINLSIKINKDTIFLQYKVSRDRMAKLVKYTVKPSDIDHHGAGIVMPSIWDAWVECNSWEFTKCRRTIESLKDSIERLEQESTNWRLRRKTLDDLNMGLQTLKTYKDFLSMTLRYRLGQRKSLKINPEDYMSTIGEATDDDIDDLIDDELLSGLQLEAFGEVSSSIQDSHDQYDCKHQQFYELLDLTEEDVEGVNDVMNHFSELLDENMTTITRLVTEKIGDNPLSAIINRSLTLEFRGDYSELIHRPANMYSNHPLWDDLISEVDNKDKRMLTNIMNGISSGYDVPLSRSLLWLLDIKEKQVHTGMRGPDMKYVDPVLSRVRRLMDHLEDNQSSSDSSGEN
uniref:RNA-directed RNA polymerase L n=1 Tax=Lepidopteran phenui-related virus OKIAV270 TaxID=2746258 RepID=A0A7D7FDP8_9VIRU|nr:RNA-dependent RNA polymerase [Lepidopteran phenui-related virus OKIAV270]